MRFAHLADTHLGYRQYNLDEREEDFYSTFHEAIDKIVGEGVDFVIHSGDLFNEPRPHIKALLEAKKALEKLKKAKIPFITIPGNHDILMRRGSVVPHALYRGIDSLTLENSSTVIDDIFICGIPYLSRIHSSTLKENLKKLGAEAEGYSKKIIILHQGIDAYLPFEYELKIKDLPKGFDYYAMGHVHKRVITNFGNGKLVYPGSTEIWRIDELEDYEKNGKGFYVVDTEDFEVRRVDLEGVRPFIKREIDAGFDLTEIKKEIQGEKSPIISLRVASDPHEFSRLYQKITAELSDALYLDVKRKSDGEGFEVFTSETIDIKELMQEVMKDYPRSEVEYAYSLFKALSSGDLDTAKETTEEFYKHWGREKKAVKRAKEEKKKVMERVREGEKKEEEEQETGEGEEEKEAPPIDEEELEKPRLQSSLEAFK